MKLFALTWIFLLACGMFLPPVVDSTAMVSGYTGLDIAQTFENSKSPMVYRTDASQDTVMAAQWLEKAEEHLENSQPEAAVEAFQQAASIYYEVQLFEQYVRTIRSQSLALIRLENYREARELLLQAEELILEHDLASDLLVLVYDTLNRTNRVLGNFQEYLENAITRMNLATELYGEVHYVTAETMNDVCGGYFHIGQLANAVPYCEKANEIREELSLPSDQIATGYNNLGIIYNNTGRFERSIQSYNRALELHDYLNQPANQSTLGTMINLSIVLLRANRFIEARGILQIIRDEMEIMEQVPANLRAGFYQIEGRYYQLIGDYSRSLSLFNQAISLYEASLGKEHPNVATAKNGISDTYYSSGDYEQAFTHANLALEIRKKAFGHVHPHIYYNTHSLGRILLSAGNPDQARTYFDRARDLAEEIWGSESDPYAGALLGIAQVLKKQERVSESIQYLHEALAIQKAAVGERSRQAVMIYQTMGDVYYSSGAFDSALQHYQYALIANSMEFDDADIASNPSLNDVFSIRTYVNLLQDKSKALTSTVSDPLEISGQLLALYELFDDVTTDLRKGYISEEAKLQLSSISHGMYDEALDLLFRLYNHSGDQRYLERAFAYAEQNRATLLMESLTEVHAKRFSGIPDSLLTEERDLREQIQYFRMELLKQEKPEEILHKYRNLLFTTTESYQHLISRFEDSYPDYYQLKYNPSSATLSDIRNLLDPSTAWLQYFFGEEDMYLFVMSNSTTDWLKLPLENLIDEITEFTQALRRADPGQYVRSGSALYDLLIKPAEDHLADKQHVVIIPDAQLFHVPFEALLTHTPQPSQWMDFASLPYLLNDMSVSYHYSASLYNLVAQQARSIYPLVEVGDLRFGGFAPVFDDLVVEGGPVAQARSEEGPSVANEPDFPGNAEPSNGLRAFMREPGPGGHRILPPLPYSEEEVTTLSRLFSAKEIEAQHYVRQQATKEKFLQSAGNYSILHVATHGFAEDRHPSLSGLIFYEDNNAEASGILYAGEMYNLDLNAALVVLSGCETGVGEIARGEGLMAMTRGLIHSGADNILVSLWKVYDEHTKNLMISFYSELLEGQSIPEALRNAKLQMIGSEAAAFPGFWSGFVHIGH